MSVTHNKIGHYDFTTGSFDVDFTGRLKPSLLAMYLLCGADNHANERGFGMDALAVHGCAWVLSRLAIEIFRMPLEGERFTVETYIEDMIHNFFTGRSFIVTSATGERLAYGRSVWAMISKKDRKPVSIPASGCSIMGYETHNACPMDPPEKQKHLDLPMVGSVRVLYNDIDLNAHMNSVRMLGHVLDLFPMETYRQNTLSRLDVAYLSESRYGDTLNFHSALVNGVYNVEVINKDMAVCRARLRFCKNINN